uniref:Uncharacterized protein n=1 Tax=candidate division CPR3 bacterium TaxID=2268181 RepID=A0A7C4LZW5_UNCC3
MYFPRISKKLLKWEILSALFVIFIGSFFHFIYELSGYNNIVAVFSAVNESTWEHTKLAFFPLVIFSLIQYPFVKKEIKNYFTIKSKESFISVILIIVIFYTYSGILGKHYLFIDILTFILAVIGAKLLAYIHFFNRTKENQIIPIFLVTILGIFFTITTFLPPHIQLFKDNPTGAYGRVIKNEEVVFCTMDARLCPDGSYVGRTPPKCDFAPCPDVQLIYDDTLESVQNIFISKYPKYAKTLKISINKEVPGFARGEISFEPGQPGGEFLAYKKDNIWQIAWEGNGEISCDLQMYGFPDDIIPDCAK